MDKVKRCIFCGKKVDSTGHCINPNCPDYIRTKLHEEEINKHATNGSAD